MKYPIILLFVLTSIPAIQATLGIDLSASFNNFVCLKNAGYSFAIVRGYKSYGEVDSIGLQNAKNAKAAGLITDAYFFPCKGKLTVDKQVNDFVAVFGSEESESESNYGQYYGTVWIDVEYNPSTGCGWTTNTADNCNFLTSLVNALKNKGKIVGIYASKYQWQTIMGSATACSNFKTLPLWYPHYDGSASFSDYSTYSFGGWTKPSIKQYKGTTTVCGVGVDLNFY